MHADEPPPIHVALIIIDQLRMCGGRVSPDPQSAASVSPPPGRL